MSCETYKGRSLLPCPRRVCALTNLAVRILAIAAVFSCLLAGSALGANPIPTVVGPVVPQAVIPGSGAFTLKVYGANFVSGAVVNWNRSPRTTTFVSARELHAQILAADVAKPTAGYVTVTNPPPGGGVSSSSYATVEVHEPTTTISAKEPGVYLLRGDPVYTVTADFIGDGKLDLVSGVDGGQVELNVGNGDGTFQGAVPIGGSFFGSNALAFGDFNGDGNLDLVYAWQNPAQGVCGSPPCYLKVLLGKGHGKFHGLPVFDRDYVDFATGIVAGDFNGDGILDLAVFHGLNTGLIFLGNGDGTFRRVQTIQFSQVSGGNAVAADFNGDGKLDLVVEYDHALYLLLGNRDGTFQRPRRIVTDEYQIGCSGGSSIFVNDFNGDGKPDLAFCDGHSSGGSVAIRLGILLGKGDGTFQGPVYYSNGSPYGEAFTTGGFNSDGKTDLIVSGLDLKFNPDLDVLWGKGDGTFQKPKKMRLPHDFGGIGMLAGDFNSDGLLDFVKVDPAGLWVYIKSKSPFGGTISAWRHSGRG